MDAAASWQRGSVFFLFTLSAGYAMYALDRSILSSVLSVMETDLSLTKTEVGFLGSAQYAGVLAVVMFAGYISDLIGRKKIMLAGLTIFTVFTWMIGFAQNFFSAFLFRLISGVGEGLFWPVAMAAVAERFAGKKGISLGIFHVGFDAGSIAGVTAGALAFTFLGSWRYAFLLPPLAAIPVIVAMLLTDEVRVRKEKEDTGSRSSAVLQVVKKKEVNAIMVFAFLATWASVWQSVFLPYYFYKVMHFSVLPSALLSSLVLASGALGKASMGKVSDLIGREKALLISSLLVVLAYLVFFFVPYFEISFGGALVMGFFSSSVFPVMQALATEYAGKMTGSSLGLTTTSQSVATVLAPALSGYLFYLGVGRALSLDAVIPSALMSVIAVHLVFRKK
ncbi:MAG: MFS transporter [Conexivisphaerales archaeon]